ncbi:MAG: glycosyl transferase group 1 [Puniceicoccaceae bacterium 5H]|nr:MAG: glycosyl transferase group 1 [Puniceicoccaceae bacterium 5H]
MPRFLFLSVMDGALWGGSELLWAETAQWLQQQGHDVHACTFARPGVTIPGIQRLREAGVTVGHWRRLPKWFRLVRQPEYMVSPAPAKYLAQVRPDLFVINNGYQIPPFAWTEAGQQLGIPYVHVAHTVLETVWPDDPLAQRVGATLNQAAAAFWVSEANQRVAFRQFVAHPPVDEVVRNPYQVSRETPFTWPETSGLRLAFVGRLANKHKGCDLILDVLAQEKWRQRDLSVDFYGDGPCRQQLEALAREWKLDRVQFKGHVSDVDGIWQEHHALLLPSRQEGLPIVIVEAMMRGRPCIVTDVCGNAELMQDNVDGLVAASPNVRALDEALERAWQARADLRGMGQRAYTHIRERVPAHPAEVFGHRLLALLSGQSGGRS